MAHHKSAVKRIKTSEKSRVYNKHYNSQTNSAIKSVLESDSKEDATKKLSDAQKLIDQLVKRNIIHKNKAANKKSQLSKHVSSLS